MVVELRIFARDSKIKPSFFLASKRHSGEPPTPRYARCYRCKMSAQSLAAYTKPNQIVKLS